MRKKRSANHNSNYRIMQYCKKEMASPPREGKKKEIYKYVAPWTVFAMNWSMRLDKRWRLAIGSFIEDYTNKVSRVLTF